MWRNSNKMYNIPIHHFIQWAAPQRTINQFLLLVLKERKKSDVDDMDGPVNVVVFSAKISEYRYIFFVEAICK